MKNHLDLISLNKKEMNQVKGGSGEACCNCGCVCGKAVSNGADNLAKGRAENYKGNPQDCESPK